MKVNVCKPNEKKKENYPRLMVHKDFPLIVLMHENKCGMVMVSGGSSWRPGDYCEHWNTDLFTPWDGTLELSND